ncbi:hypothetical protein IPM65_05665 [Candidatus Roizmanbacteria bacterium]|nr:MAG: hypothetical protein IPM65_05665 [Candidatus Roizmanbacteria bacterium]
MKIHIAKFIRTAVSFSLFSYLTLSLILFPLPIAWAEETPPPDKNTLTEQIQTQAQQELQTSNQEQNNTQETTQPTQEQSNTTVNTGDNVSETNQSESTSETAVDNNNTAAVNQQVTATANTGHNEAGKNISFGGNAGIIVTGNAGVQTTAKADTNKNTTSIGYSGATSNTSSDTTNTGNGMTKTSSSQNTTLTMVNNNNETVINQQAQTEANTGHNTADGNISIGGSAGVILTGSAYTSTNFLATANGSVILIGGDSNGNGPGSGASIILVNTGDNNDFASRLMKQRSTTIRNSNSALISQSCGAGQALCMANTGHNHADRNIGLAGSAGIIQTGDALVYVDMKADANDNSTTIANNGNSSQNSTDILNTGDNTTSDTSSSDTTNTDVTNTNKAAINQQVNAVANTGYNTANRNISFGGDAGVIFTGDAAVIVKMDAKANENSATLKEETNDPVADSSSSDPLYTACGTSGQNTEIINTGDNLQTDTSTTSTTDISVTNTNKAFLVQKITGQVDTGSNTSSRNIGSQTGIIGTGDAVLAVQTEANANTNKTEVGCQVIAKADPSPTPTPTQDPTVTPTPTSGPNPTATPTTTPTGNGGNNGGTKTGGGGTTLASTSTTGYKGGVPFTTGDVLGASVSRLPTTGPEDMISFLLASLAVLLSGGVLRKTTYASRSYTFKIDERG